MCLIQPMISHPDIEGFISRLEIISVQGYGSPKRPVNGAAVGVWEYVFGLEQGYVKVTSEN